MILFKEFVVLLTSCLNNLIYYNNQIKYKTVNSNCSFLLIFQHYFIFVLNSSGYLELLYFKLKIFVTFLLVFIKLHYLD